MTFITGYFESGALENRIAQTEKMIATYVKNDPTAFCSYEDFLIGVDTIKNFCLLRAKSIRGQLDGTIPSTIRGQSERPDLFIAASSVWLPDMGEIVDLNDGPH